MELGGHAPVVIFDDCDLERTVETLAIGKSRNAGQVCVSPTRFYVQDAIHDRFVAAFTQRYCGLKVGNGLHADTQMGPLANSRRISAMAEIVGDAEVQGARVLGGGARNDGPGNFWQPTVLADVPLTARVMNDEPFGPIAAIARFRTLDEAVDQANRLPFGLAAFAFTENARQANLIADALESGMVGINTTGLAAADAPFGGVKQSGHGAEDGPEGLMACLVTKTIHQV